MAQSCAAETTEKAGSTAEKHTLRRVPYPSKRSLFPLSQFLEIMKKWHCTLRTRTVQWRRQAWGTGARAPMEFDARNNFYLILL